MADAVIAPSKGAKAVEKLRNTAGVVAALAGAITGMWTIYEKVKADARQYTADSYETLAPQLNKVTEALQQIQQENQQLRQVLAQQAGRPIPKSRPPERKPSAKPTAAATPAAPAPAPAAGTPPAPEPPPPPAPTAEGAPPAPPAPAENPNDPLGQLIGGVQKTREAVESMRRVPETFEKALEQRRKQ
jgi:hypothetical protein